MASNKRSKNVKGALDRFEPGGDLGPVEDRNQYDERLNSRPAARRNWRRRARVLRTSVSTLNAKEWTFL
jgi:hypothetical protein